MYIEHLAIRCQDIEKMRSFYESYFGATSNAKYINAKKEFESYFLSFKEGSRLELMSRTDVSSLQKDIREEYIGLAHFAMRVGSEEKVNTLTEQLRNDGFTIIGEPRRTGDGYYESVVLDPENNRIEITA